MKQALLGSQIFCGERFYDDHALLIDDKSIVNIVDKNDIPDNKTPRLGSQKPSEG